MYRILQVGGENSCFFQCRGKGWVRSEKGIRKCVSAHEEGYLLDHSILQLLSPCNRSDLAFLDIVRPQCVCKGAHTRERRMDQGDLNWMDNEQDRDALLKKTIQRNARGLTEQAAEDFAFGGFHHNLLHRFRVVAGDVHVLEAHLREDKRIESQPTNTRIFPRFGADKCGLHPQCLEAAPAADSQASEVLITTRHTQLPSLLLASLRMGKRKRRRHALSTEAHRRLRQSKLLHCHRIFLRGHRQVRHGKNRPKVEDPPEVNQIEALAGGFSHSTTFGNDVCYQKLTQAHHHFGLSGT